MKPNVKWILPALVAVILLGLLAADVARVLVRPGPRTESIIGAGQHHFLAAEPMLDLRSSARLKGETPSAPWTGFSFGRGWSRLTKEGVWALGDRSELSVFLIDTGLSTLFFEARACSGLAPDHPQRLEVLINRTPCASLELESKNAIYRVSVPDGVLRQGSNKIELVHAEQRSPRQSGASGDSRPLAAHYKRIALIRDIKKPRPGAKSVVVNRKTDSVAIRSAGRLILPFTLSEAAAALNLGFTLRIGESTDAGARFQAVHLDGEALTVLDEQVVDVGVTTGGPVRLKLGRRSGNFALVCDLQGRGKGLKLVVRHPSAVLPPPSRLQADRRRPALPSPAVRPEKQPDVVLLILDAARVDHMGRASGYHRSTTPLIDRVTRSSLRFSNVRAQASYTSCSVPTILTGLSFASHGVVRSKDRLHPDETTLAETLSDEGYRTLGFSASANNSRRLGFEQGYDEFHELWRDVRWNVAIDPFYLAQRVRKTLEKGIGSAPLFLMIHLVPPHAPYQPRAVYHRWGDPTYDGACDGSTDYLRMAIRQEINVADDDLREMVARYDGNLLMVDRAVERILRTLVDHGRPENTLLLITSDHGEAFLEHGELGHNSTVYDEMLRVPLIIRLPGGALPEGIDLERQSSLEDLVPTILGVVGAPVPERVAGLDLLTEEDSDTPRERMLFRTAENPGVLGIRLGRFKAMVGPQLRFREVYDLVDDPGEQNNLAVAQPLLMALMTHALTEELFMAPAPFVGREEAVVSAADRAALEALGYAQ